MLSFSKTSNEALYQLAYQKPPNLATELAKCFQKVIDYKTEQRKTSRGSKLVNAVNTYFKEKVGSEVLQVIEKYTGLELDLAVANRPFFNCAVGYSIRPEEFEDKKGWQFPTTEAVNARYTGKLPEELYKDFESKFDGVKSQKELEELSRSILNDKSAMKAGLFRKYKMEGVLYFCPFLFFNVKEMCGANFEEFTADQIAAIVTHECGHVISFLVHAKDICYKKEILYNGAKKVYNNLSEEQKLRFAKKIIKHVFPEKYKKMQEKIRNVKNTKSLTEDGLNTFANAFNSFVLLIGYTIAFSIYGALRAVVELFLPIYRAPSEHIESYDKWGKSSDFAHNTSMGGYYEEELADEYVSKMGYTHHLTSGLEVLRKIGVFEGTKGYHNIGNVDFFFRLLPWIVDTVFFGIQTDYIHPTWLKREENALMDIIKAFKSDNMDPRLLDDYYKAFRDVKRMHDSKNLIRNTLRFTESLHKTIDYILTTPTALLVNGRFKEEYERCYRQAQQLMHNQLYALSYGLKRKVNK